MSIKSLISQTATYGLTTIIARFIGYFLTPYLTYNPIFTESMYGMYSYYYSLIPFGLTLLSLGLESGFFRFSGKCETNEQKERLYSTIFSFIITISLLFFAIISLLSGQIYDLIGAARAGSVWNISLVASIIAVDAITSIPFASLREKGYAMRFMKIKVISVVVNLLLTLFFYSVLPYLESKGINTYIYSSSFGIGYLFVANLIASAISLLLLQSNRVYQFRFHIDKTLLRSVLLFSLPIFVAGFAGIANDFIDRQLLYFMLPEQIAAQQMGIYSAVLKLGAFIYLFTQMYRYAAEPFFLSQVKSSDFKEQNAEALKYFTIASMAIFLFVLLFMDYFQYFVGDRFRDGLHIAPLVLIANVLFGVNVNLSYWYKVEGKSMMAIYISLSGFIVTIIANIILIPRFGYVGSAWARVLCFVVMVVVGYILNQRYMHTRYDLVSLAKYALLTTIILISYKLLNVEYLIVKTILSILFFIIFVAYFIYQERIYKRFKTKKNDSKGNK